MEGYKKQSADTRSILLALNIADDYFKAKSMAKTSETDIELKDKEMYDLKHDLINGQVELERLQKDGEEKTVEISSLQAKIEELEQELDELLKE